MFSQLAILLEIIYQLLRCSYGIRTVKTMSFTETEAFLVYFRQWLVDKEIFCLNLFKSNALRRPDILFIFYIPAITKTGSGRYSRSNPVLCHRVSAILYRFACFESQVSKLCFDIKHTRVGKIIQNVGNFL